MATWEDLVAALQPKRGKRGFAATIDEGRVAAALMIAQDSSLPVAVACDKCSVPSFRSRAGNMANTIKQLGMQDVLLPERFTASELADAAQPETHGRAKHTPVKDQSAAEKQPSPSKSRRRLIPAEVASSDAPPQPPQPPLAQPVPPLAQPVRGELTPQGKDVKMMLETASPGGTTVAQAAYKCAAETPEGEDAEARAKRLDKERHRLLRARGRLDKQLQQQRTISMRELDAALDRLDDSDGLWQDGKLTRPVEVSEERRIEVYNKFQAARHSCAVELIGVVEALTVEEVYALYPCAERPEYRADGRISDLRRPEEHRCACGSSLRLLCWCDQCALDVAILLEREQEGWCDGYGVDQNWEYWDAIRRETAHLQSDVKQLQMACSNYRDPDGTFWTQRTPRGQREYELLAQEMGDVEAALRAATRAAMQSQDQRGLPSNRTHWWQGYFPEPRRHEKSMHLADRLLRSFPGTLVSESKHAMAVYRRVSATELILDNWTSPETSRLRLE